MPAAAGPASKLRLARNNDARRVKNAGIPKTFPQFNRTELRRENLKRWRHGIGKVARSSAAQYHDARGGLRCGNIQSYLQHEDLVELKRTDVGEVVNADGVGRGEIYVHEFLFVGRLKTDRRYSRAGWNEQHRGKVVNTFPVNFRKEANKTLDSRRIA